MKKCTFLIAVALAEIASTVVILGGVITAMVGGLSNSFCLSSQSKCRTREGNTMVGVGLAAMAAGITGLAISAVRLERNEV
jgi:hypothetical protein